jgi:hypothetical protein
MADGCGVRVRQDFPQDYKFTVPPFKTSVIPGFKHENLGPGLPPREKRAGLHPGKEV